jgi:hypothetical protein
MRLLQTLRSITGIQHERANLSILFRYNIQLRGYKNTSIVNASLRTIRLNVAPSQSWLIAGVVGIIARDIISCIGQLFIEFGLNSVGMVLRFRGGAKDGGGVH